MKHYFKRRGMILAILASMVSGFVLAGCGEQSSSSSQVKSSVQSSVAEQSEESSSHTSEAPTVDSDVESETSKEESKLESEEVSNTESSVVSVQESSEVELSVQSSADDSEISEVESLTEKTTDEEFLDTKYVLRYGTVSKRCEIKRSDIFNDFEKDFDDKTEWGKSSIASGNFAILGINDDGTYTINYYGFKTKINQEDVDLYPEDFSPDLTDPLWKDALRIGK